MFGVSKPREASKQNLSMASASTPASRFLPWVPASNDELFHGTMSGINPFLAKFLSVVVFHHIICIVLGWCLSTTKSDTIVTMFKMLHRLPSHMEYSPYSMSRAIEFDIILASSVCPFSQGTLFYLCHHITPIGKECLPENVSLSFT